LIDQAIWNPESNIRLAWEAVTLGNRLLVGLCQCFQTPCTCATQKTSENLSSFKNSQSQLYCRERARKRDTDTVYKQYSIGSTSFVRQQACILHPALIEGELGIITAHGTTHGDRMVSVDFTTRGILEILDRTGVQSTFVYKYAVLRVLMIGANCFFLLTCLFFCEK